MNSDPSMSRSTSITTPRAGSLKSAKAPKDSQSRDIGLARVLGSLQVWQKLTLLVITTTIPIAVLLYSFFTAQTNDIQFSAKEQKGLEYLLPLKDFLNHTLEYRDASVAVQNGDAGFKEILAQEIAELNTVIPKLQAMDAKYGTELKTTQPLNAMLSTWSTLEKNTPNLSAQKAYEQHSKFLKDQVLPLFVTVANNSNLILDPDLDTFYLMDLVVNILPSFTETVSQRRGLAVSVATKKQASADEKFGLAMLEAQRVQLDDKMTTNINFVAGIHPGLKTLLDKPDQDGNAFAVKGEQLIQAQAIKSSSVTLNPKTIFDTFTGAIDNHFTFYDLSATELSRLLQIRVDNYTRGLYTSLAVVFGSLLLVGLVAFAAVTSITGPVNSLVRVVRKFGQGDLSETVPVTSRDELGLLSNSFNESIERLRGLVSTEQDRDNERRQREELQQNIGEFLNVTMDIAQGDMTKRGKVSDDVLGNVVDAINLMAEELGYVLKDVQGVATTVNNGANTMSASSDSVLKGAAQQAKEAATATTDTQNMAQSIRKMAQRATESATAATQTLTASQQGTEAVNNTLQGMQAIRREVSHISKGIKGLSDRSLEISEIVEAITSIASQTNLLALNAAIEASGAGEAGSRFAIVADEVRRLADDSAKAAARVGGLIKNVQGEIQQLVSSVEGGTKEVEQGYRIATQAGERLREISDLANQSSALAQAISGATGQQVQGVERVAQAVSSIAATAQKTQEESSKGRQTAEELRNLAAQLSGTLDRFRLPA